MVLEQLKKPFLWLQSKKEATFKSKKETRALSTDPTLSDKPEDNVEKDSPPSETTGIAVPTRADIEQHTSTSIEQDAFTGPLQWRQAILPPILLGFVVIATFVLTFVLWSAFAPLESAAIAPGIVTVEGKRKTVQHLEGGIVREILVQEGDRVASDQVLLRLDQTQSQTSNNLIKNKYLHALAVEARLTAELQGAGSITFPETLLKHKNEPDILKVLKAQTDIFFARRRVIAGEAAILSQKIAQYQNEILGYRGNIRSANRQISLIFEESQGVEKLLVKGLARKPRLLALQRRIAEIEGSRSQYKAQISRIRQGISETRLEIHEIKTSFNKEVMQELRTIQNETNDLSERLRASRDILKRTEVRAPQAGIVVGLKANTIGGVVAPGEPLLDIVPSEAPLIIEARVNPNDIDIIKNGLKTQIRLTAFKQRNLAPLEGIVTSVSADRLVDETSGDSYFATLVRIHHNPENLALYPGMQAEVIIVTGERTLLSYLFQPLSQSFNRALRED
ncbi:HlyD family type I secretion periplasmic adaptor subunit [Magnetococcales bacterium HHB-1]